MKNLVSILAIIFIVSFLSCSNDENTEVRGFVAKGAILDVKYEVGEFNPTCKIMVVTEQRDTVMAKINPSMMIPGKTAVLFHNNLPSEEQGMVEVKMLKYGKTGEYEILSVKRPKK